MANFFLARKSIPPEEFTLEAIYRRVKADFNLDDSPGPKLEEVLARTISGVAYTLYSAVDSSYRGFLPHECVGKHLDRWAQVWGLKRDQPEKAKLKAIAKSTEAIHVLAGQEFQHQGETYIVTQDCHLLGEGAIDLQAKEPGKRKLYNGEALADVPTIAGLQDVVIHEVFSEGRDGEEDQVLRQRLLRVIRKPLSVGSLTDYVSWALEAGAKDAWVGSSLQPVSSGNIVKIVEVVVDVLDEAGVGRVRDFLTRYSPFSSTFQVRKLRYFPINIALKGPSAQKESIISAVEDFFAAKYRHPPNTYNREGEKNGIVSVTPQQIIQSYSNVVGAGSVTLLKPTEAAVLNQSWSVFKPVIQWSL